MTTLSIVGLVAALAVALPAFFLAVVFVLSVVSGWRTLAASYSAHQPPAGTRFTFQSGSMGGVAYNNCLTVHVAPDGLFLAVPVLAFIHKPLFIPWSAIHDQQTLKVLWRELVRFRAGSPTGTRITLPRTIFDARASRTGDFR